MICFVLPFTMFYYESDSEKNIFARLWEAGQWWFVMIVCFAIILAVAYSLAGYVDYNMQASQSQSTRPSLDDLPYLTSPLLKISPLHEISFALCMRSCLMHFRDPVFHTVSDVPPLMASRPCALTDRNECAVALERVDAGGRGVQHAQKRHQLHHALGYKRARREGAATQLVTPPTRLIHSRSLFHSPPDLSSTHMPPSGPHHLHSRPIPCLFALSVRLCCFVLALCRRPFEPRHRVSLPN